MVKKDKQLTLSDLVVLSLLSEKPMHGYQIVNELEMRDAKDWAPVSRPQVYYSVKKLVKMKLISPAKDNEPVLGPERVQYKLTVKGEMTFLEDLYRDEWATDRSPPPFLTWMALSSHLSRKDTLRVIHVRKEFLTHELARERITLEKIEENAGAMTVAAKLMIELTCQLFEAELQWINQVEKIMTLARK